MIKRSGSDRGNASVIGAILMVGILLVAFAQIQATLIPRQNTNAEFNNLMELQDDFADVHVGVHKSKNVDTTTAAVTGGGDYPNALVAANPPPFSTRLRVVHLGNVTVKNFDVQSTQNEESYWESRSEYRIPTSSLVAAPQYNYLDTDTTQRYENQVYYTETETNGDFVRQSRTPVDGNRIELHGFVGSVQSAAPESRTQIQIDRVSGAQNALYITGDSGNIQVDIETMLSESAWREIIEPSDNPNVISMSKSGTTLSLVLSNSDTYALHGYLSSSSTESRFESLGNPAYIASLSNGDNLKEGKRVTINVHDKLGNTIQGARVSVSKDSNNCVDRDTLVTNRDGSASFTCQDVDESDDTVTVEIDDGNEDYESMTFNFSEQSDDDLNCKDNDNDGECSDGNN